MPEMIETLISIPKALADQIAGRAERLNLSQNQLFELAVAYFLKNAPDQDQPATAGRVINQGDVYWLQGEDAGGIDPGIPHPHVIIQENILNHSRIDTVVVCALTSNIKRINLPGNILLESGEANLPRQSVVEVSKISTVAKNQLGEYIGSLSAGRVTQILAGLRFLQQSFFER